MHSRRHSTANSKQRCRLSLVRLACACLLVRQLVLQVSKGRRAVLHSRIRFVLDLAVSMHAQGVREELQQQWSLRMDAKGRTSFSQARTGPRGHPLDQPFPSCAESFGAPSIKIAMGE